MKFQKAGESPKRGEAAIAAGSSIPKSLDDLRRSITMAHIAKAAGISQGAISSLLNDRDYGIRVGAKTRERVFKACRELGYVPNDLRAVVRMYPELGDYCLLVASNIVGGLGAPIVTRLAAATMAAIPNPSHAITVALYDPAADYLAEDAVVPASVSGGVCSKFLIFGQPNQSLFELLGKRSLPAISLGYDVPLPGVTSFAPDYALASRLALGHLSDLGHKTIGIVSGPFGASDPRLIDLNSGVRMACEQLRLPLNARNIVYCDLSGGAGRLAFDELFTLKRRPTAIFCMSDSAAIGMLAQAQERSIAVPGTLSLIGLGDDAGAELTHPRLTTVRLPIEEMAEFGVNEINRSVHEAPAPAPRKTVPPLSVVERQSCGPRKTP